MLNGLRINQDSIKNEKQTKIITDHWTIKQVNYFYAGEKKSNPSTPMQYSELTKIAHTVNRRFSIKKHGIDLLFNEQNYTMKLIKKNSVCWREIDVKMMIVMKI